MKVECEISNYAKVQDNPFPKVIVRSVFANGGLAEIQIENTKFIVSIDEMRSALSKCQLDCFGK